MNIIVEKKQLLKKYQVLLLKINREMNLISRHDEEVFWEKHVEDSLALGNFLNFGDNKKLIDLGSGGGLPGIPLAIYYPNLEVALLDSTQKKIKVLDGITKELNLKNVKTVYGRIEEIAHQKNFRGKFDLVTAKALAPLNVLLEYAMPFLEVGGVLISYKGPNFQQEIQDSVKALEILNSKITNIYEYKLKNDLGSRAIVLVE